MRPFHLAFPITDIEATRHFYGTVLGCRIGRESPGKWIDFDLFGHQMSAHLRAEMPKAHAPKRSGSRSPRMPRQIASQASWAASRSAPRAAMTRA